MEAAIIAFGAELTAAGAVTAGSLITTAAPFVGPTLSVLSAGGQIVGGFQESAVLRAQGAQSELAAKAEELKGREQANKIRESLLATIASQTATFASRNVDIGGGTPVQLADVSRTQAAKDIESAQFGADIAAEAERLRAKGFSLGGRTAITKGFTSGFGSLIA